MDSVQVRIAYRPLRIGWAIRDGDLDALRLAASLSFAFWGGTFNPIIVIDQPDLAKSLVEHFRVDVIYPLGSSSELQSFTEQFPYLVSPFFPASLFLSDVDGPARSQVLDVHNALSHLIGDPAFERLKDRDVRLYSWEPQDPLADVLMMQFGTYPNAREIKVDYQEVLKHFTQATEFKIDPLSNLAADIFDYPSVRSVSRSGIERHYSVTPRWDTPGFFSGDARNFDDLVCYWNLRASDIPLLFVDPKYLARYGDALRAWGKDMQDLVTRRGRKFEEDISVWVRLEAFENTPDAVSEVLKPFQDQARVLTRVSKDSWNGSSLRPPMMHLGEVSTLGVIGTSFGRPKISFAFHDKPFSADPWFHTQKLVASLYTIGGLYGDEQQTFSPPFIPELNQFYSNTMILRADELRSESEGLGLIIDATDASSFIQAMPVAGLVERVFELAGFSSKLSASGLIARQLITQLGGVDGARAFKIPGVRRLLKTHGPTTPFTKGGALGLIASKDLDNPNSVFKDYEQLFIEPRAADTRLTPEAEFSYLVEKGLFRIGSELTCPNCRMSSWTALDALRQRVVCELCGREFDATRQLVAGAWHYRRSGVLGAEKNAQGAVPVVLTLQQLKVNLSGFRSGFYSPSLDLVAKNPSKLPTCEIDFAWLIPQPYPNRTKVIIGECKDRGAKGRGGEAGGTIDANDVENLRQVADALPRKRFETFIVLAKLCPFTEGEINLAKLLNDEYRKRAIILTARELEPYHFYDRTKLEHKGIREFVSSPEDLAKATDQIYFTKAAGVAKS